MTVLVERVGMGVARVVVDAPPANALTIAARRELAQAWGELRDDGDVRSVVVTGAGDTYFSAGLDLTELASDFTHPRKPPQQRHDDIDRMVWDPISAGLWKPIVVAVNGYCLAGGLYLALMGDVRIAADHARFGVPEVRWSHPAAFTWELTRHLPLGVALEMTLWGERQVEAERLLQLGLLNAVVPGGDLESTALRWAQEVARLPARAVSIHKKLLYEAAFARRTEQRAGAEARVRPLHDGDEAEAGIRAYLARRRGDR